MSASNSFRTFITAYHWLRNDSVAWAKSIAHRTESTAEKLESGVYPKVVAFWNRLGLHHKHLAWINPTTAFIAFFLLLLTRSCHWIANPQFYIEDGNEFYGIAFNNPDLAHKLKTLPEVYMGYYHLIPRIVSVAATMLPPKFGPILMELAALLIQALTGAFFLSKRLQRQIPSVGMRILCGLLVVGYPYSNELFGNVAHSQWYLALLATLILCADPGESWISKAGDYVLVALISVTGPFSLILAPIGWVAGRKDPHRRGLAVVLSAAAIATVISIFTHSRLGFHGKPRFSLFARMLSNQVVIGSTLGFNHVVQVQFEPLFNWPEFFYACFAIGVIVFALIKGTAWIRGLATLGLFTLATSLYSGSNWIMLGAGGVGERYFFYLGLIFVIGCALASLAAKRAVYRWGFRALVLGTCFGVIGNWIYAPPFHQFDYPPQIAAYDQLSPGQHLDVQFPIDRKSWVNHWTVTLQKY